MSEEKAMCQCQIGTCGYIYDPKRGDKKGKVCKDTGFDELPEEWHCPCCGAGKKQFKELPTE